MFNIKVYIYYLKNIKYMVLYRYKVGDNMNIKRALKNMDKPLLFLTIFMLGFGLLNIVTSSSREAVLVNKAGVYYYFYRQMGILIASTLAAGIVFAFPTKTYKVFLPLAYVFVLGLCVVCFYQSAKRGANNWIVIGGFQVQPSELSKPVIIASLALIFDQFYDKLKSSILNNENQVILTLVLFTGFLIPALIFLQKDLGTSVIILGIVFTMLIFSPIASNIKKKIFILLIVVALMGALFLKATKGSILSEAQLSRFDYINPCSKYEKNGYQVCNAYIAFNDGGVFGLGIGKSKQKYSYIPEPHTDSIFAIIGEEWGVLASLAFVFVPLLAILYRIMKIASKANTVRGRFIALGAGTGIFLHILVNLGGLLGLLPLTGVPLPFLSYGGSYTLGLMISLAMVQRVAAETKMKKIKVS